MAAAIELQSHGLNNITILERDSGVGGTWLQNSYPGAACDVPSHMYSFSYAQRRDWSRLCSPQEEILSYVQGVARDFGVERFVEVGPGRVLSGLIRRIAPDAETIPLDEPGAPGGLADPHSPVAG